MKTLQRRQVLGAAGWALGLGSGLSSLSACTPAIAVPPVRWVGASHTRGHRVRQVDPQALPTPAVQRRAAVLVLGAGVAGLAAARGHAQAGVDDVHLLDLEDHAGGNSRGHVLAGMACPLGAHYLPLPGPQAHEVSAFLHEVGLLRSELGRTVADERHLCHSPQERLFIDGAWAEGLLPPTEPGSASARQISAFAATVARVQQQATFAMPAHRAPWNAVLDGLNRQTFANWLDAQSLNDPALRWYLDYACRDDYGAPADTVSAWAGLHYFASRHGFHAPGEGEADAREGVFTWPEGNAWLVQRLAQPFSNGRLHTGRTVLRVTEQRHGVQVLAFDEAAGHVEAWTADRVVLALPLFVAARVVDRPPQALREAAGLLQHAPWLVANLHLDAPLLDRPGAPPSWDSVVYGSDSLGYVDAMHQSLRPHPGPTVLTAYCTLPRSERAALLSEDPAPWAARVLADLRAVHPDIDRRVQRIDLMRWGHAMAIPQPGVQRHPALTALRQMRSRLRFAHSDLSGYSVFEEAFTAGCEAAADAQAGPSPGAPTRAQRLT